jgi:hypothetical protein
MMKGIRWVSRPKLELFPAEPLKKGYEEWIGYCVENCSDGDNPREFCCVDTIRLAVGLEQSGCGDASELFATLEEGNLQDKEIPHQVTAELLDEITSSGSGSTCKERDNC